MEMTIRFFGNSDFIGHETAGCCELTFFQRPFDLLKATTQLRCQRTLQNTVLPRFTRLLWQIKNRVNQNSRYTSPSMDKMIVQKMSKKFL